MYERIKNKIINYLRSQTPLFLKIIDKNKLGLKYAISGGLAAILNISLLYALTDFFGLWYVVSSVTVYVISTILNFALLKFWAFRDPNLKNIHRQLVIFGALATVNFFISPSLLVFFVEVMGLWYLTGQLLVLAMLALTNFIINKKIIFRAADYSQGYESAND